MSEFNGIWNYFGYRLDRMLKDSIVQDFNKLENRIHEESRYSMEDGLHQRYIAGLKLTHLQEEALHIREIRKRRRVTI